jgi:ABC-2 type transport system permease protein
MLIAKDRSSSFLTRLFASPLSASDYILGYALPLLPIAIMQSAICFLAAFFFGLAINVKILVTLMVLIPTAVLYMGFGLLAGSLFNDKQVGGICGALLTNLSAWLSGTWFDLNLVGGAFEKVAELLPFVHAVDAAKAAISGEYSSIFPHLLWVIGYGVVIFTLAVVAFRKKMKGK